MGNSVPLVSIIIPLHNRADELPPTLKCLLAQTEHDWEAIVVDDHSTDDALVRAKEFADLDTRFRVVSLPDDRSGAPAGRNFGLSLARGEFVLFLDADDLLSPTCLTRRIAALRARPELDFIVGQCQLFRIDAGDMPALWNADTGQDDLERLLSIDVPWGTNAPLWRRASLRKIELEKDIAWDETVLSGQDWEFHLRALLAGLKYDRLSEIDCHWRVATGDRDSIGKSSFGVAHARARPALIRRMYDLLVSRGLMTDARKDKFAAMYCAAAENIANRVSRKEGRAIWREARQLGLVTKQQYKQFDRYLFMKRWPLAAERRKQRIEAEWPTDLLPKKAKYFNVVPPDPNRLPTVSVVLSAYNAADYIRSAVESILNQTFRDFEFIIIDDGSTDGTGPLLRRLADSDCRIRLVSRANKGLAVSLNEALDLARGEFIARMDGDDLAHPARFEKQVAYLRTNPECVALGTRVELIDPFDAPLDLPQHKLTHNEIDTELLAGMGWAIVHPTVMFRADVARQIGNYRVECDVGEDLDLFLRLAEVGRIANLPDVLLKYRQHLGSINRTRFEHQIVLTRAIVNEAAKRRGLTNIPQYTGHERQYLPPAQQHLFWGWQALRRGHPSAAAQHAVRAIRFKPWSIQAWKLLRCGIRGH